MGKRQRDCADCGAPVGFLGRQLCCRCMRRLAEDAAKAPCPGSGKQRILQDGTGRCVACSRACANCGHPVRSRETTLCRDCRRGVRQQAARQDCPKCGRPGLLREVTGWCGHCSRPRQGKWPPRVCGGCGELRRHAAAGLCSACWQRHPDRPFVRGSNLAARLARPPEWLGDFIAHLAARHGPARACTMITALGRLLEDLLEASIPDEHKQASSSLAVDWSDVETFSRPPRHGTSDCADPEASWGHRKGGGPGQDSELFFGYYASAATMMRGEHGPAVPELAAG